MAQALNIINQRFGHLVALEKAPSRKGKTYWKCQCDCGTIKEVQTGHLTSGATITCGGQCKFHNNSLTNGVQLKKYCILCSAEFYSGNTTRQYCYSCSPQGVESKIALRYKKRALKHILVEYKGGKCEKCGYNDCEGALEFHHLDPLQKDFNISHINLNNSNLSLDIVKQEVDKCILICANCHAKEHYLNDIDSE